MIIRSGVCRLAVSSTSSPSATGTASKPFAFKTSQKSLRLRSLSSTTIIRLVTTRPAIIAPIGLPDYPTRKIATMPQNHADGAEKTTRAATLALAALGWVLEDDERAGRYLELTGLEPDTLRSGLGDPTVLASCLDFLANYEPDLIRAAEALAVTPEELMAARQDLSPRSQLE